MLQSLLPIKRQKNYCVSAKLRIVTDDRTTTFCQNIIEYQSTLPQWKGNQDYVLVVKTFHFRDHRASAKIGQKYRRTEKRNLTESQINS